MPAVSDVFRKDARLDELSRVGNVAQFFSCAPGSAGDRQEFAHIRNYPPNVQLGNFREALSILLSQSNGSVNIRSFAPGASQSQDFHYGLRSVHEADSISKRLLSDGFFIIVNETVDVDDGGVSGVVLGDVLEFTPKDTPRGVEKPGLVSIERAVGLRLLESVYGFRPTFPGTLSDRIEFSIHPKPVGCLQTRMLLWEISEDDEAGLTPRLRWPNHFSRFVGDKTFGLLVGASIGLPVPRATVIGRHVPPFTFGTSTSSLDHWTRTAPAEQTPGLYTTIKGWVDPFMLLASEDPHSNHVSAILYQDAVDSLFAGAAVQTASGDLVIEGTSGDGDAFMTGKRPAEPLPEEVMLAVTRLFEAASQELGPVRFEWAYDGTKAWLLQLHQGSTLSTSETLYPGDPKNWVIFETTAGLESLRSLLKTIPMDSGIILKGSVGITSHFADVVRKAMIPTKFDQI